MQGFFWNPAFSVVGDGGERGKFPNRATKSVPTCGCASTLPHMHLCPQPLTTASELKTALLCSKESKKCDHPAWEGMREKFYLEISDQYSSGTSLQKRAPDKNKKYTDKNQTCHKIERRPLNFPTFGAGIFCWTPTQPPTHTPANDHRCQASSPTIHTYMRKFNLHQGGRKPSVWHSCWCWGFMSISKHPGLERGCCTHGSCPWRCSALASKPSVWQMLQGWAQNKSRPLLSLCCWRSWSSSAFGQTTYQGQGQEGTRLLASSAGGQVEFSLTSYPCHLCLSLQINSITLDPQTEQIELVLFKGNIKSL